MSEHGDLTGTAGSAPVVVERKARFAYVDALRGIAALAVVLLHLYHYNLLPMTGYQFPQPLHAVFDNGHLGVYVFFVISGFVITQSIHGERVTPRFTGWFALRRSVRLDLPYWATIAAMIVLTVVSNHMQHARSLPVPTPAAVLAHLVYVQGFLEYPQIVGVFWTLCYEVQFYLTLILLTGLCQWIARSARLPAWLQTPWTLFLPLWIASLVCATGRTEISDALFLYCWPYFFLGVAVNWAHHGKIRPGVLMLLYASLAGALVFEVGNSHFRPIEVAAAIATSLSIYVVSRAGKLASLTLGRVLQYLGRISYSLYLVHMLVGTPAMRLGIRLLGKRPDFIEAVALVVLATAISIVAAHLMHVLVERPATRLSQRLREQRKLAVVAPRTGSTETRSAQPSAASPPTR